MSIDEIIGATHSRDSGIRERSFWRAAQLGAKDFEGFAEAGVHLEFFPDERGQDVESVMFYQ